MAVGAGGPRQGKPAAAGGTGPARPGLRGGTKAPGERVEDLGGPAGLSPGPGAAGRLGRAGFVPFRVGAGRFGRSLLEPRGRALGAARRRGRWERVVGAARRGGGGRARRGARSGRPSVPRLARDGSFAPG